MGVSGSIEDFLMILKGSFGDFGSWSGWFGLRVFVLLANIFKDFEISIGFLGSAVIIFNK